MFYSISIFFNKIEASQFVQTNAKIIKQRAFLQNLLLTKKWGDIDPQDYQEQLADYPLYPNLEYYYLLNNIKMNNLDRFSQFFENYSEISSSSYLRKELLLFLGKKQKIEAFNLFYKEPNYFSSQNNVNSIECYKISHQQLLLNSLQSKNLKSNNGNDSSTTNDSNNLENTINKKIKLLYLQNKVLPDNCQTIIKKFDNKGLLSDEIKIQKISLAIQKKNYQLAKSIRSTIKEPLAEQTSKQIKLWDILQEDPSRLIDIHKNKRIMDIPIMDSQFNRIVILDALHKLLRQDPELSYTLWKKQKKYFGFSNKQISTFNYDSTLYLYINDSLDFIDWLELTNSKLEHPTLNKKMLILAIKSRSWSEIISLYRKLSDAEKNETIWQYWFARSHIEYDQSSEIHPNALLVLEKLSTKRDYYGFLASFLLNKPPTIGQSKTKVKESDLKNIAKLGGIVRAYEFYMLKDFIKANREWYSTTIKLNREQKGHAALLAYQWGWLQRAIATASSSSEFNNISMRFPRGYSEYVKFYAANNAIPNEWVFSVIRQESAYGPNAESSAGALGLMQIMPATGKELAKQNRISGFKVAQLTEPELNIKLATYFLAQLREQYNGNMLVASAAYNAGPGNVNRWLKETRENNAVEEMPIEMWIETIPFKETRNYVKNILTYQIIYQQELGRESNSEGLLLPIKLSTQSVN